MMRVHDMSTSSVSSLNANTKHLKQHANQRDTQTNEKGCLYEYIEQHEAAAC